MNRKAQNLSLLYKSKGNENFLPLCIVTQKDFIDRNKDSILSEIFSTLGKGTYAVRSSAKDEDQLLSQAGKYLSLMKVGPSELIESIRRVFLSYGEVDFENEVFIQSYLANSHLSGVLFTKDPNAGSNYYVVNFEVGSDTEKITSGKSSGRTFVLHKSMKKTGIKMNLLGLQIYWT